MLVDLSFDHFSKPTVSEAHSIGWAIDDLQGETAPSEAMFYHTPNATPVNQRRMDYLIDNDIHDLPNSERPPCQQGDHTYPRLRPHALGPALAHLDHRLWVQRSRAIHPSA